MNDELNTPEGDELSRRLTAAATTVTARPDLAEVEIGAGRVRGRRRLATGVAAAMLIAGAGGAGFGIGRSVSNDDQLAVADEPALQPAAESSESAEPSGREDADEPVSDDEPAAAPSPAPATTVFGPFSPSSGRVVADIGRVFTDDGMAVWAPQPMELLVERTLASGVRVRLQGGETWDDAWQEDGWTAADFCFQNRDARVTFDGVGVVDVGSASLWSALFRGVQAQLGTAGWADAHPLRYLVVQADPGIAEVAVTWSDGLADRTAVSAGYAVLVVEPGSDDVDVWSMGYTLELIGPDGTRTVTMSDLQYYDDPEYRAACSPPPPALPEPGEQPADPVAAEQALRDRFDLLWDNSVPRDDKRSVLDDWAGVDAAADAVFTGGYAESAETASHEIDEISFTSPTEAWFRYSLYTDITNFSERYGTATLVDGEWQFARAVMCQDLSLGGGQCDPGFEAIYPPSWYERYGGPYEESCYETEEGTVCESTGDVAFDDAAVEPRPVPVGTIAP